MDTQFRCKNEGRRIAVRGASTVNGIDYLEVASTDQRTLKVVFIHDLPVAASELAKSNVVIEGGVRTRGIQIVSVSSSNKELTVIVSEPGDFSIYTLRIVTSPTEPEPPIGFDPYLSAVDFSFKVECPSEFDCEQVTVCPPLKLAEPEIDYLAKDYASFRSLILDRLSGLMPNWRERNPADLQIALVELLAYAGDHLSYFQDAVATEAYLGTARQRISVRRHARMLDYLIHEGSNARMWVCVDVTQDGDLPSGTVLLTRGSGPNGVVRPADLEAALVERPLVFETLHGVTLYAVNSEIRFYTWSDSECCLPRGSTRATLLDSGGVSLEAGDVLIFEEVLSPTTGTEADADPNHRHAVRLTRADAATDVLNLQKLIEIEWHGEDALPFPLCLTALIKTTTGAPAVREISVARGNVVLADYGRTISGDLLVPTAAPENGDYRPQLRLTDITFRVPYNHEAARLGPASSALDQDPRETLPDVTLSDGAEQWIARRDLLNSDRFAAEFVVEMERDGTAHLRFGDDVAGKKPSASPPLEATYRVGNGCAGNVGPESITRVVTDFTGIRAVRNALAARSGTDAESMEEVRQFAPQAFRIQQRAVTEVDWAEVAERHREVQKAAARFRWFGSWYTVLITIDRQGGRPVKGDEKFIREIEDYLNQFRIAGYDLEINDPVPVPLDVLLTVCVKPGYFRSNVKETLFKVFSNKDLEGGGRGFFHPDNFTFGQPVYLSRIYQTAMNVAGVASVEPRRFQRFRKTPNNEIENGALSPASLEIIRLDNDPSFPENGKIAFEMHGGL